MKKLLVSLLTLSSMLIPFTDGYSATITSTPSPAVSNKPLEIKISGQDLGSTVYCYTWCAEGVKDPTTGKEYAPYTWDAVNTSQFQMTGSGGTYTFKISDIKTFYKLTDSQLASLTKLGFIAKNANGGQTDDLFIEVVQGRTDAYSGGEGTATDPFILKTSQDIKELAATPGDWTSENHFRMDADIDAAALTSAIGSVGSPFAATFDGNGHTIKNLTLSSNGVGSATGLFGCVNGATIRNLGVTGATVNGTTYTGLLIGLLKGGMVERCFTMGSVAGTSICVGGLVGENEGGQILNCYSGARVSNPADYATGGLVGKNQGTITNTYAGGAVTGYDYVGGIVGANYSTVKNSLALNEKITASNDYVARFGGNNNSQNNSSLNYSWEHMGAANGQWTAHGDHASTKGADILRNESQFKSLSGWDFNTVWEWRSEGGKEYPVLRGFIDQPCPLSESYFAFVTSVEETFADGTSTLQVGPNPTSGPLYINSSAGVWAYTLYSINGQLMMSGSEGATNEVVLDLSGLANGLYILRTVTVDGIENINKIIKK